MATGYGNSKARERVRRERKERLRLTRFTIQGASTISRLLRDEQILRPTPDEVWQAVMDQVLDELSEEWG